MTEKIALVTAASRGMGAAIARELAASGYKLALMARSDGVTALADELGAVSVTGSVLETADLKGLVDLAMATYGRIDAVVNNTGHPPKGDLLGMSDADWALGADMVLMNVVRMARLTTPIMQAQGGGAVVNMSTFAAFEPTAAFPVSATFRAALGSFTKIYADEYAKDNIRMNNIAPGYINSFPESEALVAQIPMGRYGMVEEVARAARFLVSDDASYITGQHIRADGGITRSV